MKSQDRGSVTPIMIAAMVLLLLLGTVGLAVAQFADVRARSSSVADLAALAGAQAWLTGDQCSRAAELARASDAQLQSCVVDAEDVLVAVAVPPPGVIQRAASAAGQRAPAIVAVARAGPGACDRGTVSAC